MELKFKIEIEGEWVVMDFAELHDAISFGNHLVENRKVIWTGLKDRNGVDVYEGDILNIEGQIVSVIWDNKTGGFTSSEYIKYADRGWDETFIDHPDSVEVIGNIHQHPHLLA